MKIERFEQLEAWKEARALVSQVYRLAKKTGDFERDYRFRDQLTAATVSSMSNIAEGFARRSDQEFTHFFFITKSSCAEVQSLLYVVVDQRHLTEEELRQLYTQADKVARLTSGLISYLLQSVQK